MTTSRDYVLGILALAIPLVACHPHPFDYRQEETKGEGSKYVVQSAEEFMANQQAEEEHDSTNARIVQLTPDEDDESEIQGLCGTDIYVLAFTSGSKYAGSDDSPYLRIYTKNHQSGSARFPDNPGNDMLENKGDFWKFSISHNLGLGHCISKAAISSIVVENGGNDGWKIESIFTILRSGSKYTVITADVGINKLLDGDPTYNHGARQITLSKTPNV